ncbi:MAG: hypothetical protein ACKVVT_19015 [Dehalococcoidia bacterium]
MQATIELDNETARALESRAAALGITVERVIESALRGVAHELLRARSTSVEPEAQASSETTGSADAETRQLIRRQARAVRTRQRTHDGAGLPGPPRPPSNDTGAFVLPTWDGGLLIDIGCSSRALEELEGPSHR